MTRTVNRAERRRMGFRGWTRDSAPKRKAKVPRPAETYRAVRRNRAFKRKSTETPE